MTLTYRIELMMSGLIHTKADPVPDFLSRLYLVHSRIDFLDAEACQAEPLECFISRLPAPR